MPEFDSPSELAIHLFDRALEPGMTGRERLRLAVAAGIYGPRLYEEYSDRT